MCNIRCLKQAGKKKKIAVILILSILLFHFLKCKKIEFHEKCEKNTFNQWDILMQTILVKLTLYLTENAKKKEKNVSFPGKTPLKLKKK